jgi:molybdopterin synthase sulfur carrier subunit
VRVRVRLFASLREAVGQGEIVLEMPDGGTAEDVWQRLVRDHPELGDRRARLTAAINRSYATFETALRDGDEIVFVPPVSGG